jgi:hypothetical protein
VQHIGAFSDLHGKIGDLGVSRRPFRADPQPEEQTKVIQAITSVIQALSPPDAIGPVEVSRSVEPRWRQGILGPIVDRINAAVGLARAHHETAQPALVQSMNALAACFKGLSPSDDDMFDLDDGDETTDKAAAVAAARSDPTMLSLRGRIESAITAVADVSVRFVSRWL